MEIERKLNGSQAEIELLFENFNIRFYEKVSNDIYNVVVRVSEEFNIRNIKTIKSMARALYLQDEYFKEENIKDIVAYIK